jgi:exosortase/archaeosortase family protein
MRAVSRSTSIRLAVALTGVVAALYLMEQSAELQRLLEPLNLALARVTELALRLMDIPVARRGTILAHPDGFSYRIAYVCSGVRPAAVVATVLLNVPATRSSRLAGICIGILAIEALNLCRLVHLYWTGVVDPEAFAVTHGVFWNIVAVVAVSGFVVLWLHFSERHRREEPLQPDTYHAVR